MARKPKLIRKSELLKAIQRAVYKTFYKELVRKTPGKGIVADEWDVIIEKDQVIIINRKYGDIVKFLEYGTGLYGPKKKKYTIVPKDKKALRWKSGAGDRFTFATKVEHPGIKARKFVNGVMEDPVVNKQFDKELELQLSRVLF